MSRAEQEARIMRLQNVRVLSGGATTDVNLALRLAGRSVTAPLPGEYAVPLMNSAAVVAGSQGPRFVRDSQK